METEQVAIIGAGPSGLTTALQLKRYGITPRVFEKNDIGGLLNNANLVENYPGFPGGIPGIDLVKLFEEQVKHIPVEVTYEEVTSVAYERNWFRLVTDTKEYRSSILVIASGTKPRRFTDINIPGELDDRVFYEVAPLLGIVGKRIAIVGAGDAAFDYALNLGKKNKVDILNRSHMVKCLPLLWQRASSYETITYHQSTFITGLESSPTGGMSLACETPSGSINIRADYLIGAIGRDPQLDFIPQSLSDKLIELEEDGNLYIIGDVKNGKFRQTAIAVGEGIMAAMKIYRYLKENGQ
jgi:thioredoxin reductase